MQFIMRAKAGFADIAVPIQGPTLENGGVTDNALVRTLSSASTMYVSTNVGTYAAVARFQQKI